LQSMHSNVMMSRTASPYGSVMSVSIRFSAELATGIEPVTSSLPRKCSTN